MGLSVRVEPQKGIMFLSDCRFLDAIKYIKRKPFYVF